MLLVGDIGGTKTDLALFPLENNPSDQDEPQAELQVTFKSSKYASLEEIIHEFITNNKVTPTKAVFGVAGPVHDGESKITNLPWHISEKHWPIRFTFKAQNYSTIWKPLPIPYLI